MSFSGIDMRKRMLKLASSFLNDNDHFPEIRFSESQLVDFIRVANVPKVAKYKAGDKFSSLTETSGLKDYKLRVSVINSKILNLEKIKKFIHSELDSTLKSQGNIVRSLESEVREIEIKYLEKADVVHVNNFSKERDKIIYNDSNIFRKDFKTKMAFEDRFLLRPFFGLGASLALKNKTTYIVDNCVVIDEMTNVGDTFEKIFRDEDPNHVFRPEKIFRHAIIKRSKDTSSRRYKRETSYNEYPKNLLPTLTIEADLESYSAINYLEIDPVSLSGFSLKSLIFFDGDIANEIEIETKVIDNRFFVFFQTMYTRKIQFVFQQKVCIENSKVIVSNKKNYHLNTAMRENGFFSGIEEDYQVETGYVYDLSIRSIEIGKLSFLDRGLLYSKPIEVENFLSSKIDISSSFYGEDFYIESYLGLILYDRGGNLEVESLIPLPDSKMYQNECLVLAQGAGRAKLFPDVFENACLTKITLDASNYIYAWGGIWYFDITLDPECFNPEIDSNGLLVETAAGYLIGPDSSFLGGVTQQVSPGVWRVGIKIFNIGTVSLDEFVDYFNNNLIVYSYFFPDKHFFDVYRDGEVLEYKTDYSYSLDNGSTWSPSIAMYDYFYQSYTNKVAGNFLIRINNENANSVYTVRYKIDSKQVLDPSKNVYLENEILKLIPAIRKNTGKCYTVIICRAPKRNSEEIFILNSYQNKIYEDDTLLEKTVTPFKDLKINLKRSML